MNVLIYFAVVSASMLHPVCTSGQRANNVARKWSVAGKGSSGPPHILEVIEIPQFGNWQLPELWPTQNNEDAVAGPTIGLISDSGPAEEPCQWEGTAYCSDEWQPICVTDFNCIYTLRNHCMLRKLNCVCQRYHVLQSKFCDDFKGPSYRRCNVKVYLA